MNGNMNMTDRSAAIALAGDPATIIVARYMYI